MSRTCTNFNLLIFNNNVTFTLCTTITAKGSKEEEEKPTEIIDLLCLAENSDLKFIKKQVVYIKPIRQIINVDATTAY